MPRKFCITWKWPKVAYKFIGEGRIRLDRLANGNVRQDIPIYKQNTSGAVQRNIHIPIVSMTISTLSLSLSPPVPFLDVCLLRAGIVSVNLFFEEESSLKIDFNEWTAENLPRHPNAACVSLQIPRDWRMSRWFKNGGVVGRKTLSESRDTELCFVVFFSLIRCSCLMKCSRNRVDESAVGQVLQTNTTQWETLGHLRFFGTRSEFDNQDLIIRVWRYRVLGMKFNLLGKAVVPLAGVLESQLISTNLSCAFLSEPVSQLFQCMTLALSLTLSANSLSCDREWPAEVYIVGQDHWKH